LRSLPAGWLLIPLRCLLLILISAPLRISVNCCCSGFLAKVSWTLNTQDIWRSVSGMENGLRKYFYDFTGRPSLLGLWRIHTQNGMKMHISVIGSARP